MDRRRFFSWVGFSPIAIATGGSPSIYFRPIDAIGADASAINRLTDGLQSMNQSIDSRAVRALADALNVQIEKFRRNIDAAQKPLSFLADSG